MPAEPTFHSQPTDKTLLEHLHIMPSDIEARIAGLQITDADCQSLQRFKPAIRDRVDGIVDGFYQQIINVGDSAFLIGDSESLARLKRYLRGYILELFDGTYDSEYVHRRLRIGQVHKRIGVSPELFTTGVSHLQRQLRTAIIKDGEAQHESTADALNALAKVLMLDLGLVFDMYIHAVTANTIRQEERIRHYASELEAEVAKQTEELREIALSDGLTGLKNHRCFYEELRAEIARSQRRSSCLSIVYIDLDGFKRLNDTKGHSAGDACLIRFAGLITQTLRESDLAARYGGDEFCVILPDTDGEGAYDFCRRLIALCSARDDDTGVTMSLGVATTGPLEFEDAESFTRLADTAMYRAKSQPGHTYRCATDSDSIAGDNQETATTTQPVQLNVNL